MISSTRPDQRDASDSPIEVMLEYWLGYSMPSPERVRHESAWSPDTRDDYCSRCGVTVGPGEASASGCGSCRGKPGIADGILRLGAYTDDLRNWIINVKYHQWAEMGAVLGRELGRRVIDHCIVPDTELSKVIVVPMPMPWQRRIYRGIDHARLIAEGAAKVFNAPVLSMLCKRNGPPQVTLPRSQRKRNGSQGLKLRSYGRLIPGGNWIRGSVLLLVDDVCTTGATLRAGVRLLRTLKPERIIATVVAVSDDRARRSAVKDQAR